MYHFRIQRIHYYKGMNWQSKWGRIAAFKKLGRIHAWEKLSFFEIWNELSLGTNRRLGRIVALRVICVITKKTIKVE